MRSVPCKKPIKLLCSFFSLGLLLLLSFSGCELYGKIGEDDANIQGALPELLRGEWIFIQPGMSTPAERYIIANDTIQYIGYADGDTNYKGEIRFVSNYSTNSGVIIIEYTESPSYDGYNGNSFFGIYYRNLKRDTVQLANAISPDHSSAPDTATLEEAVGKFTRLNMGSYVDWSVVQPQKRVW